MDIPIYRSRTGIPCLWEEGGGRTNTGSATIVADPQGRPKPALYIRSRGSLANGCHALIPVKPGDVVVVAGHHRRDFRIQVLRLTQIGDDSATVELVAEYGQGEWAPPLPEELRAAVQAAKEKATCYHCRSPHYCALAQ